MVANERTQIRPRRQIVEMAGGYIVGGSRPHKMLGADLVVRSHVASSGKPVAPKVVVDLMPRTERRRASKPKVRTGCKTCKSLVLNRFFPANLICRQVRYFGHRDLYVYDNLKL